MSSKKQLKTCLRYPGGKSRAVKYLLPKFPKDITEYRELLMQSSIRVDVLTPPMVSIIQSMDTKPIDFYEAALKNVFIQNDGEKLQKAGIQGLRLRRSKPIREKENTLEFCMRIK